MRNVRIQVMEDRATGVVGMVLKGIKLIDAPMVVNDGYGIAHDILDHQNGFKAIGSIADEIEAMGGMWFARGQWGEVRRTSYDNPHQALANDLSYLADIHLDRNVPIRASIANTRETSWDHDFDLIIEDGVKICRREFEHRDEEVDEEKLQHFAKQAKHLLRRGFRKARSRFDDNPMTANNQFWAIAEAVDNAHLDLYEGAEYNLRYGDGKAIVTETHGSYYD